MYLKFWYILIIQEEWKKYSIKKHFLSNPSYLKNLAEKKKRKLPEEWEEVVLQVH